MLDYFTASSEPSVRGRGRGLGAGVALEVRGRVRFLPRRGAGPAGGEALEVHLKDTNEKY